MARRVYVETSVWGMVAPNQNLTLQPPTIEFLARCQQGILQACISDIVLDEIDLAPAASQIPIKEWLNRVSPEALSLTKEIDELASRFISEKILPPRRLDDATHVACAIVYDIDLLVSWNYRHIANVRKAEAFNAVAVLQGYSGRLEIHTPWEVLEWK